MFACVGFGLAASAVLQRPDSARERRLARIERKLQLIMDQMGIIATESDMVEVVAQLERDKKIQAIKAYREATGAGLKEAKSAVEAMARERGL